jgi:uncharacterized membrane protein
MTIVVLGFEIMQTAVERKSLLFHVKRFLGRVVLSELCLLFLVAVFSGINFLFSLVPEGKAVTAMLPATLIASLIILYVLFRSSRIRGTFDRLEEGDW